MKPAPRFAVLTALAIVAGCADDDDAATDATVATTIEVSTTPSSGTEPAATVPEALSLAVGWLNGDPIDEMLYGERFTAEFVEQLPYAAFSELLRQFQAQGPWTIDGAPEEPVPGAIVADVVDGRDQSFTLSISVADPTGPVIESLLVEPAAEPPTSPEEALERLRAAGTLRLLTAEVSEDDCTPLTDDGGDDLMPLGSVFKLYVLGAVVDAVEAGELTWDTPVTIRDELDSIPSGTTQDEPPGTQLSIREMATRMISVSDNTATDHLIDLVGREAVEGALAAYGHAAPEATVPFLMTREFTIIKFSGGDLATRYGAASQDERRALLAGEVAGAALPPLTDIITAAPTATDTVEWFASPADICRALARLQRSAEATEILAINPGVPSDRWSYVGFKGGSEPGVLAVAWLVEGDNGQRYVLAGGVANPATAIPESIAIDALAYLRDNIASG